MYSFYIWTLLVSYYYSTGTGFNLFYVMTVLGNDSVKENSFYELFMNVLLWYSRLCNMILFNSQKS